MYKIILLAYDGSNEGRQALREGARLAKLCDAQVILLAVVDLNTTVAMAGTAGPGAAQHQSEDYNNVLEEGLEHLRQMGLSPQGRLENGEPVERIVATATAIGADLVVVGHHRQNLVGRWLLGSVTEALIDKLDCSLLAARSNLADP
ncbi:MAG: universal stress protein [Rhodobacteraceae bacterium]|nr:universal stress protein [Paracoccaceae bacterium]